LKIDLECSFHIGHWWQWQGRRRASLVFLDMTDHPDRIPVIVGVGQVNDRPDDPLAGRDPVALAAAALREAARDTGVDGGLDLLADAQFVGTVKQISFPDIADLGPGLAAALGTDPEFLLQSEGPSGDSPVRLLNDAANRIGAGEISIALVGGGEALRTAAARVAATENGRRLDPVREAPHRKRTGYAAEHGLVAPVDIYPLYENAMRHSLRQSLAEAQAETAEIWFRFSEVAAQNPAAWVRRAVAPSDIITPSAGNRPIAFPYTKLQVANSSVNQGAGFIVTSVGEARRRGIASAKWIYVGNGAAARESDDIMARDRFDASASMQASLRRALELNGLTTDDLSAVELYSCFPCIVKLARRVIGWPVERPASVFGGLTFGGGPVGNYMSHAVCSIVTLLRQEGGIGLLFANGGLATSNHSLPLGSSPFPGASFPRSYDVQAEAEALRGTVPKLDQGYLGPATVETWTVTYGRDHAPDSGTVVARTPAGARTLATLDCGDEAALAAFTGAGDGDAVGRAGRIEVIGGRRRWTW